MEVGRDGIVEPLLDAEEGGQEFIPPLCTRSRRSGRNCMGWMYGRVLSFFRLAYDNGPCCVVVGEFFHAVVAVLIKLLTLRGIPFFQFVFVISLICTGALLLFWPFSERSSLIGPREVWCLQISRTVLGVGLVLGYYACFTVLPTGNAMTLTKLTPIFTAIFAWLLRWEHLNLLIFSGVVVCCGGAVLVEHPPALFGGNNDDQQESSIWGVCFAVASSVLSAVTFLITGRIGKRVSTISLTFWLDFPAALIALVALLLAYPTPPVYHIAQKDWFFLVGLGISNVIGTMLKVRGVQLCNATYSTTLQCSTVLFSYILGYFILKEAISVYGLIGTGIIAVGIWMLTRGRLKGKLNREIQRKDSSAEEDNEGANLIS